MCTESKNKHECLSCFGYKMVDLATMDVVSLKISGVFDDGTGRLIPAEMPCILIPGCLQCGTPTMDSKCETCGLPYCPLCLPCPNCVETPEENTSRTFIESCEVGDSGSTEELVVKILPSLYEKLREDDYVVIEDGFIAKTHIPLGECFIDDEIVGRYFGTSIDDFKRLSRNASWEYPNGMVLINLDRERALVFPYNTSYEPQIIGLSHALEWLKEADGTFGLIVKKGQNGKVYCEFFKVITEDEDVDLTFDKLLAFVQGV